ncbi:hypothetical protein MBLNU459_g8137t2 [Dothideomycetes sp. NU459]
MVSILQRMRKVQTHLRRLTRRATQLFAIRLGSGAAILPKDVSRIHMRFAQKIDGGHMGPRPAAPASRAHSCRPIADASSPAELTARTRSKFWRHELVRLKYHNPAVPMTIDRSATAADPATMTVFFTPSGADPQTTSSSPTASTAPTSSTSGAAAPSAYTPADRTATIDMTGRASSDILAEFLRVTNAEPVVPTPEETEQLRVHEEAMARSARESKISADVRENKRREAALLAQARGDVAANAV